MSIEILLPSGVKTVIDRKDLWIRKVFPVWGVTGSHSKYVFVERSIKTEYSTVRERVYLHRVILGLGPNNKTNVDHIDRNKLNNKRNNLRVCSLRQNRANVGPKNGKRFKGVFEDKTRNLTKPFSAYIDARGAGLRKRLYLGRFTTAKEAAAVYNKKARELWGDFAYQNVI